MASTKQRWVAEIEAKLLGRKITGIRYMTDKEVDHFGWARSAVVIQLDDGGELIASADDEGNDAGAIFTNYVGLETIPVI